MLRLLLLERESTGGHDDHAMQPMHRRVETVLELRTRCPVVSGFDVHSIGETTFTAGGGNDW